MGKVKLVDVAIEHKEYCSDNSKGYPVVGLEHLSSGEVTLNNWNENANEIPLSKYFAKGMSCLDGGERT